MVAHATRRSELAARLFGAGDEIRSSIGWAFLPFRDQLDSAKDAIRAALGDETFARAFQAGQSTSAADATAEAFALVASVLGSSPGPVTHAGTPAEHALHGLSPRELDVLRLLPAGKTDQEIADALFISRRTVTTHVGNILAKLGVHSRAEAVDAAHRYGLLNPRDRTTA